jgi:hypothetical protein
MGQITFKSGTLTFKGGTLSFQSVYSWTYVATYSSYGDYGQSLDFTGIDAGGDIGFMIEFMEDIENAANYPGEFALFEDISTLEYYLFVSTY